MIGPGRVLKLVWVPGLVLVLAFALWWFEVPCGGFFCAFWNPVGALAVAGHLFLVNRALLDGALDPPTSREGVR